MFNAKQAAELTKPLKSLQSILNELETFCEKNKDTGIDSMIVGDKGWINEFYYNRKDKTKEFTSFFESLGFKVEYIYEEKALVYQVIKISW